jgi:putative hydrolase of the HAD superfamily
MLRAVTFDYWNTLFVDPRGRERQRRRASVLRDELDALGMSRPALAIDDALQAGYDYFERVWRSEQRTPPCPETVDATLFSLGVHLPEEAHERLVRRFETLMLDVPPEPVPGALFTLPPLAERYRLAVVCDTGYTPGSVLRELLARDDMLAPFEYLYFSNEHEACKPDARVFLHTLAELEVRPQEAAHVGDLQRTDVAGAQAAGMLAVHFVGANNHDAARSTADVVVRHFDELPEALGGLICPGC